MVVLRLSRGGSKKNPFYDIVATYKSAPRDGRFIEQLGYFNPVARGQSRRLHMKPERVQYWLDQGAQPSERVKHLYKEYLVQQQAQQSSQQSQASTTSSQAENSSAQKGGAGNEDTQTSASDEGEQS